MAKTYSGGVTIATGFKLNDPQPIVDYMVVDNLACLDGDVLSIPPVVAIPNQFIGMTVFVHLCKKVYWMGG